MQGFPKFLGLGSLLSVELKVEEEGEADV